MLLTTIFVEVLISETELVRIEENAKGIRRLEALIRAFAAAPIATGRKKAVAAVLLMKAESTAVAIMIATTRRVGFPPAAPKNKPACHIDYASPQQGGGHDSNPRMSMTVSLPNPLKALFAGTKPVKTSRSKTPRAVTSAEIHSKAKKTRASAMMARRRAICSVTRANSRWCLFTF